MQNCKNILSHAKTAAEMEWLFPSSLSVIAHAYSHHLLTLCHRVPIIGRRWA
ncbi:hypothetical protein [Methylobacter sp. Wu1]|uniref:hypothetical protein n=1 Tax=Methylobacter sp. Wu1 TaxID=3119359 RepID=UPI002F936A7A